MTLRTSVDWLMILQTSVDWLMSLHTSDDWLMTLLIGMLTPTDILQAIALPSASNIGWRFQAAELHSTYAYEETHPIGAPSSG